MTDEEIIPLVEERLSTTTTVRETGRVRVRTRAEQRDEMVTADLARDEVEIERVPTNTELSAMPAVRQEGDVTIIPVVEEVLVVEKKLMLVEEIHLRRIRSSEQFAQPVSLRVQRAEVERETDGGFSKE